MRETYMQRMEARKAERKAAIRNKVLNAVRVAAVPVSVIASPVFVYMFCELHGSMTIEAICAMPLLGWIVSGAAEFVLGDDMEIISDGR